MHTTLPETVAALQLTGTGKTAEGFLHGWIQHPLDCIENERFATWYLHGQWVFHRNKDNRVLWVYYFKIWQVLECYGLSPKEIEDLIRQVIAPVLNCTGQVIPVQSQQHTLKF